MDFLERILDPRSIAILRDPVLLSSGLVMYGGWLVAYFLIFKKCFKERSYGVPMYCACANICWEFLFTFVFNEPPVADFFIIGNFSWFLLDCVVMYQLLRFGRENQVLPFARKHFGKLVLASLVGAMIGTYGWTNYFNDPRGVASSFTYNVLMSVLFIFMLHNRPDMRGISYPASWFKMLGTLGGAVFCFVWWPRQYTPPPVGYLDPATEPDSYLYINFIYVLVFLVDCSFIWMCRKHYMALKASEARQERGTPEPVLSDDVPADWKGTHTVQDKSVLDCTPETAFRFVGTPGNWPLWYPVTRSVVGIDGYDPTTPAKVGDVVQEHVEFRMLAIIVMKFTFEWEFLRAEDGRSIMYRGKSVNWGGHSQITYTFADAGPENPGFTRFERTMVYAQTNPLVKILNVIYFADRFAEASHEGVTRISALMKAMMGAEEHIPGTTDQPVEAEPVAGSAVAEPAAS